MRYSVILFCRFCAPIKLGIDVLEPNEDAGDAGALRLFDEARYLVAERIHLDHEPDIQPFVLAKLNDPIENDFPILVAGEIVVGDEIAVHALRQILPQDVLDIVGAAAARLTALHVDDGAERALERAATPRIEARHVAQSAADMAVRQEGRHRSFQTGKIFDVVI